jgi:hypothetical protein
VCVCQNEVGRGAFQELDQVAAAAPFCKYTGKAASLRDVGPIVSAAVKVGGPAIDRAPGSLLHAVCPPSSHDASARATRVDVVS